MKKYNVITIGGMVENFNNSYSVEHENAIRDINMKNGEIIDIITTQVPMNSLDNRIIGYSVQSIITYTTTEG